MSDKVGMSSVTIHGVKNITLTFPYKLEKSGVVVRHLKIKHDGGVTSVDLFSECGDNLKVIQQ